MQLVNIQKRMVTMNLSPEECVILAEHIKRAESDDADAYRAESMWVALLEACALAAAAQGYLVTNGDECSLAGLRERRCLDPIPPAA